MTQKERRKTGVKPLDLPLSDICRQLSDIRIGLFLGQKGHRSVCSVHRSAVMREAVIDHKFPDLNVTIINFLKLFY